MTHAAPRIDRDAKTITVTKNYYLKSSQYGTVEFEQMLDIKKKHPGYKVEIYHITKNKDKESYSKLTYEKMAKIIIKYAENKEAAMMEFDAVIKLSEAHKARYAYVKQWFIAKYKEEYKQFEDAA